MLSPQSISAESGDLKTYYEFLSVQKDLNSEHESATISQIRRRWPSDRYMQNFRHDIDQQDLTQREKAIFNINNFFTEDPSRIDDVMCILLCFNDVDEKVCDSLTTIGNALPIDQTVSKSMLLIFQSQEVVHDVEYKKFSSIFCSVIRIVDEDGDDLFEGFDKEYSHFDPPKHVSKHTEFKRVFDALMSLSCANFGELVLKQAIIEYIMMPPMLQKLDLDLLSILDTTATLRSINIEIAKDEKVHGSTFASWAVNLSKVYPSTITFLEQLEKIVRFLAAQPLLKDVSHKILEHFTKYKEYFKTGVVCFETTDALLALMYPALYSSNSSVQIQALGQGSYNSVKKDSSFKIVPSNQVKQSDQEASTSKTCKRPRTVVKRKAPLDSKNSPYNLFQK